MASEWTTASLADIYDFSSGLSKPRAAFGSGFPFLSFKDVFHNSAVPKQLVELVESTEKERDKGSIRRGDVFLTRTSETMDELGMSATALEDIPSATFNGFTKRLRPRSSHQIAPEFARYFFRSPEFRQQVYAMSSLSTRASLNNEMLAKLSITFPTYSEQESIGLTLGAFDDRINNLSQTNATLETIAQALFKSWFVDFDPVRAKAEGREPEGMDAATAALFPDQFEDSELGPIPNGWAMGTVGDSAVLNAAKWTVRKHPNSVKYVDLSGVSRNRIETCTEFDFDAAPSRARNHLREGDTIVGTVRPGNRACAYIHEPEENLTGSTGFAVLSPNKPCLSSFVYLASTSDEAIGRLANLADGAAYPAVRPSVVADTPCILPSSSVLETFAQIATPLLEKIAKNNARVGALAALRDTLLPRLISGKLRLPEAEQEGESATA